MMRVQVILCACVYAMLCMKNVNFHVLYACMFAHCFFVFLKFFKFPIIIMKT